MPAEDKMRLVTIILTIIILSSALRAEKLTVYTYDSFVSEWGPGPIVEKVFEDKHKICLLYTSPSPRDRLLSRMPSSA